MIETNLLQAIIFLKKLIENFFGFEITEVVIWDKIPLGGLLVWKSKKQNFGNVYTKGILTLFKQHANFSFQRKCVHTFKMNAFSTTINLIIKFLSSLCWKQWIQIVVHFHFILNKFLILFSCYFPFFNSNFSLFCPAGIISFKCLL